MATPLDNLIHALSRLPGLGRRSSERAALALVRRPEQLLDALALALQEARQNVCLCGRCGAFTTRGNDPCRLCTDDARDGTILCVVEEPSDIFTLERAGAFRGRYHALMGKLSPARQAGAAELRIQALIDRIARESFTEIVLALSTDMEGDATAGYLAERLENTPIRITRLAFGLPADSGIAYSDPLTLKRALAGRFTV